MQGPPRVDPVDKSSHLTHAGKDKPNFTPDAKPSISPSHFSQHGDLALAKGQLSPRRLRFVQEPKTKIPTS